MKIALVHELLTMRGGAERVTRVLAEMFPDAPVYTLLYNEKKLGGWFPKDRVRTSGLQPATCNLLPDTVKFNHHLYLSRFPKAIEQFDFRAFDLVISVSSAFAHGIITNGSPKHIAFINAPARYLWDRTHDVLERAGRGFLGSVRRVYLERVFHRLRIWDAEAADRADMLLAASKDVQRRIELYWRRPSTRRWMITGWKKPGQVRFPTLQIGKKTGPVPVFSPSYPPSPPTSALTSQSRRATR